MLGVTGMVNFFKNGCGEAGFSDGINSLMLARNMASLVAFKQFSLPVLLIINIRVRSQVDTAAYDGGVTSDVMVFNAALCQRKLYNH